MSTQMVRKTHTKSRRGCLSCKRRHVKCDETRPRCSPCTRLDIECEFPTPARPQDAQSPDRSNPSIPGTPSNAVVSSDYSFELSIPDLKLLHFWTLNTSLTCASKNNIHVFQTTYPELAFSNPYLLRGILAVAALHRAVVLPSERNESLLQSSEHYKIAISAYMESIQHPDPATCAPLFAVSGLLHLHFLGMAQINPPPADPVGLLCDSVKIMRGVRATIEPNWQRLIASEVAPILLGVSRDGVDTSVQTEVMQLQELIEQSVKPASLQEIYFHALKELNVIFLNVAHYLREGKDTHSMTMSWLATVNKEYVEILWNREQTALVLLAYYAVLFKHLDHRWWARGWSKWTLDCVVSHLPESMMKWIEWPRSQICSGG